jgi:hypothetical protein
MMRVVNTTALLIETKVDMARFARQGRIVRYAVPSRYRFITGGYARMQSELRDKLELPYYFFTHDHPEPGIYVLYPPHQSTSDLTIDFLNGQVLPHQEVAVQAMSDLQILVKLLMASCFQSRHKSVATRGQYYLVASTSKDERLLTCLEIVLRALPLNPSSSVQEFKVTDSATRFRQWDRDWDSFPKDEGFFGKPSPKGGQSLLRPLKYASRSEWEGTIYVHAPKQQGRTTLPFHSIDAVEESRGYLVHTFIRNFIEHLGIFGVTAHSKQRHFHEFRASSIPTELPIKDLGTIGLWDNRLNPETVPLASYQTELNQVFGKSRALKFKILTPDDLPPTVPVLILQDAGREDFEEGSVCAHLPDPYQVLYQRRDFHGVPKQSINVNPNDPSSDIDEYLDYGPISVAQEHWKRRFDVALDELYLKHLILEPEVVMGKLPFLSHTTGDSASVAPQGLAEYALIRKKSFGKKPYTTLMYFAEGQLHFCDLRDPAQKRDHLFPLLERYGLSWEDDIIEPLSKKHYSKPESKLSHYDFIVGPGQVIEIEETGEDVLYDFAEIVRRQEAVAEPLPIQTLKLAPYYDEIRLSNYPTLAELQASDTNLSDRQARVHEEAFEFLARLKAYDAFLEEVGQHRYSLCYNDLTSSPLIEDVDAIFDLHRNGDKYRRGKFKAYYQRRGMFLSDKGNDTHLYQGIWHDGELCYMVGDKGSFKLEQPVSHLLRRFDVYKGADLFDIEQWLDTVTVPFVRPKRYTVFPYFFHLLDLYVEAHLRFGQALGDAEEGNNSE